MKYSKACVVCSGLFQTNIPHKLACSAECKKRYLWPLRDKSIRACSVCKTEFEVAGNYAKKFCSKKCKDYDENRQDYTKAYNQAYRARKRNARTERVYRQKIYDRDNYVCQICFEPVDTTCDPKTKRAPSLDHIIPLSKGGAHSYDNIRLAHIGCNAKKCNKLIAS